MPSVPVSSAKQHSYIHPGFQCGAADCYLFDIDGTLLNSRDAVHYFAVQHAIHDLCGVDASIEGVPVHGNTDPGILRAMLRRAGLDEQCINSSLPRIIDHMCAEVESKRQELAPEACSGISDLLIALRRRGKLLGVASGNLEPVGWAKLEKVGLREMLAFGAFSWPRETRADIFSHGVQLAEAQLGRPASVFVVGDTPSDIEAARAIGIPVIALATGIYLFDDLLASAPNACFNCAADLLIAMN